MQPINTLLRINKWKTLFVGSKENMLNNINKQNRITASIGTMEKN